MKPLRNLRKLQVKTLGSAPAFLPEFSQAFVDLFPGEGLAALGALVDLVGELIIDEFIGEVDGVKPHREIIDPREISVSTTIAHEIFLNDIH
jgi:hypothetical protein